MIRTAGGHPELLFAQVASASCGEKREPKICEGWRCGRMFFRPAAPSAREGETLCPACRLRQAPTNTSNGPGALRKV